MCTCFWHLFSILWKTGAKRVHMFYRGPAFHTCLPYWTRVPMGRGARGARRRGRRRGTHTHTHTHRASNGVLRRQMPLDAPSAESDSKLGSYL